MRKRLTLVLLLAAMAAIGVAALIPQSYYAISGFLRGESFFAGWPSSYWADQLKKSSSGQPTGDVGKILREGGGKAVPVLLRILRDGDAQTRREAFLALGLIEPLPAAATPALTDLLRNAPARNERVWAAHALTKVEGAREPIIAALRLALADEDRQVRFAALAALTKVERAREPIIAALRLALADEDRQVRFAALAALWTLHFHEPEMRPVISELLTQEVPVNAFRREGPWGLPQLLVQRANDAVPDLIEELKNPEETVRATAALALGTLGPTNRVLPILVSALGDKSAIVREVVVNVLGKLRPADQIVPALIAALDDQYPSVTLAAIVSLRQFRGANRSAVSRLVQLLKSNDKEIRVASATALASIDPHASADAALPVILAELSAKRSKALGSPAVEKEDDRSYLCHALAEFSRTSDQAFQALIALLDDESPEIRLAVVWNLGNLGPRAKKAVPLLIARLKDKDDMMRQAAFHVLGQIGPDAKDAEPALVLLLKSKHRVAAATALGHISPATSLETALPVILEELKDKRPEVRGPMVYALAGFSGVSERAFQALIALLKDESRDVRDQAVWNLGNLRSRAKKVVPLLIARLQDEDDMIQRSAIFALGQIGPDAKDAVPALTKLIGNKDQLAQFATEALKKIDPEKSQSQPAPSPPGR
jgi:HEAT repeat protein